MSNHNEPDPVCRSNNLREHVSLEIIPRTVDLGGFDVRRVLPSNDKRSVGPFVFWDQAGPGEFVTGKGLDVRPHPHIGLSTMTYLFQGSFEHRDTLGNHQIITPGAVNLMTAGKGIAHSERTPQSERAHAHQLFGLQCWLALPLAKEEMQPSFVHYDRASIPGGLEKDLRFSVVAGEFYGIKSPVDAQIDTLFVECHLGAGSEFNIPATMEERAVHILSGELSVDGRQYGSARMLVLKPGHEIVVKAETAAHIIILGGPALDGPRYLWWNFVASNQERIQQAKLDWQAGRFGKIPGDDEYIPLPE